VTIATNMAGRGTDIQLGGNLEMRLKTDLAAIEDPDERERRAAAIRAEIDAAREVVRAGGGLFVVGSERHESRRIDNQLRGRSGRQGDPGASKFFVSLEDDLMRIFGSERMDSMLQRLGLKDGEAIIHPWVNKALAKAQQKVEARNYDIRKQLLKYDDVMNDQRKVVYEQRRDIMMARDVAATVADMRNDSVAAMVALSIPENSLPEQWDIPSLHAECLRLLALDLPLAEWAQEEGIDGETMEERIIAAADRRMAEKTANVGADLMRMAEKSLLLQLLDQTWKDHLLSLDHLRQGINLRAYAQRDPLNEYKREAFELFEGMLVGLRDQVTSVLSHVELRMAPEPEPPPYMEVSYGEPPRELPRELVEREPEMAEAEAIPAARPNGGARGQARRRGNGSARERGSERLTAPRAPWAGTPRNATCPCGSGKKFKHCHGRI
jgi:preprotein translocase subunit SecA